MVRPFALVLLAAVLPLRAGWAQDAQTGTVTGRVFDAETGAGLPGANVYLNRTSRGTATDGDGAFELGSVPAGLHEVVASMVGYTPEARTITVDPGGAARLSFTLEPLTGALGEVTVTGDRGAWLRDLARFRRAFLGEGPNARETRILNPEVLGFDDRDGTLYATAGAPLQIENRALGYRVDYDLIRFEATAGEAEVRGHGRFVDLRPEDPMDLLQWAEARTRAYRGSFQHFVHALAAGEISTRSPFRVYLAEYRHRFRPESARGAARLTVVRSADRVFQPAPNGRVAALTPGGAAFVRVDYLDEEEDRAYLLTQPGRDDTGVQVSWIEAPAGVARLDVHGGQAFDPYPVVLSGYWGWEERISNWLPRDYRPN